MCDRFEIRVSVTIMIAGVKCTEFSYSESIGQGLKILMKPELKIVIQWNVSYTFAKCIHCLLLFIPCMIGNTFTTPNQQNARTCSLDMYKVVQI